jgi:hypothetical protein
LKGEIKTFHGKQKLKAFMTTKLALQKTLEGIVHTEEEDKHTNENMGMSKSYYISR